VIDAVKSQLGLPGWHAVAMVVGVAVLYFFFTVLLGVFGQRLKARVSVWSVAFLTLIGSVAARSMLGPEPTMLAGVLVLTELLVLQGLSYRLRRRGLGGTIVAATPKAVMVDGVIHEAMLTASQMNDDELYIRLRRAGITRLDQVAYAILESDGALTVIRAGTPVDPELLDGVDGLGHGERQS
jgi:uncharacterized membrane protein YcaP (DUF421 family)